MKFLFKALRAKPHCFRLFDIGAAILFFGVLTQQPELHRAAEVALSELATQGYRVPDEHDPVRIFPALTEGDFSTRHAGGWRPGSIYLRRHPQSAFGAAIYVRHELFHEVSHRSCGGRLPTWAEEAAAMYFSGELAGDGFGVWPDASEIEMLKVRIRQGAQIDGTARDVLAKMVFLSGWPTQPCAISEKLAALLGSAFEKAGGGGYVLISLQSGRVLDSGGDTDSQLPPGSLLKIPYAAALNASDPQTLAEELARSDSENLLQRKQHFQLQRYRLLLSSIKDNKLPKTDPQQADWAAILGGRDAEGNFPVQAGLTELALAMRASFLSQPDYFTGLAQNGMLPGSTLQGQSEIDKGLLRHLQAMAKTGTLSTRDGKPLLGHLLLAWPVMHPVYLAVFRHKGIAGAEVLPKITGLLKNWQKNFPIHKASVRVHLLGLTERESWQEQADCPVVETARNRFTVCGQFKIVSAAKNSRSLRIVSGVLYETSPNQPVVLETDLLSYVDAVLAAEAQNLTGSARQAIRAVIAWNAIHGQHRHPETTSLCDTTHCMVFLGALPNSAARGNSPLDFGLLALLDDLADKSGLNWLPFAFGGVEPWERQFSAAQLGQLFAENRVLDLRRERRKQGGIYIRLLYPETEETLSCEVFRNTLDLPSCPDSISANQQQNWTFRGIGAGHGLGLSISRADALSLNGRTAEQILLDAYTTLGP